MGFIAHEVAVNPEVQEKLFAEIHDMEHELDGKSINYEQIQRLKYMDQVVCETLRKWPAAPVCEINHVETFEGLTICSHSGNGSNLCQRLCC
jgi:cytochrome P450